MSNDLARGQLTEGHSHRVLIGETTMSKLSAREQEVLWLLAAGRRNAEIAEALCVSIKTVEFHNRRIYEKLGARSRADALIKAQQRSILSWPQAS